MSIRKFICLFVIFIAPLNSAALFADTAYPHFSGEELRLKNNIIKALKAGDDSVYKNLIAAHEELTTALEICKKGLSKRLEWDADNSRYTLAEKKEPSQQRIGKMVADFLHRTNTIVMFTKGFGSNSTTGGGQINGHWEQGELTLVGDKKERYKVRKYNVVWIAEDLKESPTAIALLLAHEVGHGLAQEYRDNFPLPFSNEKLKKPPYTNFPTTMQDDDNMWCYPFEGMMAEEIGITTLKEMRFYLNIGELDMDARAQRWFDEVIGKKVKFPEFYNRMRVNTCVERKLAYLKRDNRCGMRCKNFDKYRFCDNRVKSPPCHLWRIHLESWYQPDQPPQ